MEGYIQDQWIVDKVNGISLNIWTDEEDDTKVNVVVYPTTNLSAPLPEGEVFSVKTMREG